MRGFLISSVLLYVGAAIAVPAILAPRERVIRNGVRRTGPPRLIFEADSLQVDNTSHSQYTQNWAGAVLIGTGYATISGTIVVPRVTVPAGGTNAKTYSASAWVGIDGSTCQSAILQTGIDFNVRGGSVSYEAWYEWYPDYSYRFNNFKISAGDTITMTVTAASKNSGSVVLENKTTKKSISHTLTNQMGDLCQTNAEWIVEDFLQQDNMVPFANFHTVSFTDARVNGAPIVDQADIYDIKQGNKLYTRCAASSSSSLTCSYVG
ncbi:peptidase A4 family-domain-containing protein [Poronia punctata]|nr:peptidase A4 family-domain-containing protein [Poronia punctata]